jgi:hypothetical protein
LNKRDYEICDFVDDVPVTYKVVSKTRGYLYKYSLITCNTNLYNELDIEDDDDDMYKNIYNMLYYFDIIKSKKIKFF